MSKCEQKSGCDAEATERMFWLGASPTLVCAVHAAKGRQVADALGCYVRFETVPQELERTVGAERETPGAARPEAHVRAAGFFEVRDLRGAPVKDDFDLDFEKAADGIGSRPGSPLGCAVSVALMILSAAVTVWLGWLAWQLIKARNVGDMLILTGILIAWPAWHAAAGAIERERKRDVAARISESWLNEHRRSKP